MNNAILLIGPSGTGKSTSLRNLDPQETFILNVLDKPLPWKGFKSQYKAMKKEESVFVGNYYSTDDFDNMIKCIKIVSHKKPEIKTLVIDDFQNIMSNEYMRRASEKGFERFNDIGKQIWSIIEEINACRDDLLCILITHSDLDANGKSKLKTIGKMIDEKVDIPSRFTVMFHSMVVDGKFKLLTQNDGYHIAKTPMGMFDDLLIDNDMSEIKEAVLNYYSE